MGAEFWRRGKSLWRGTMIDKCLDCGSKKIKIRNKNGLPLLFSSLLGRPRGQFIVKCHDCGKTILMCLD